MDRLKEYPTLTALMAGREPGSVKVQSFATMASWFRPLSTTIDGNWRVMFADGDVGLLKDDGPWLLVSEDDPTLDTMRLEIAARVLAGLHASDTHRIKGRYAYALAEADALIEEARK